MTRTTFSHLTDDELIRVARDHTSTAYTQYNQVDAQLLQELAERLENALDEIEAVSHG